MSFAPTLHPFVASYEERMAEYVDRFWNFDDLKYAMHSKLTDLERALARHWKNCQICSVVEENTGTLSITEVLRLANEFHPPEEQEREPKVPIYPLNVPEKGQYAEEITKLENEVACIGPPSVKDTIKFQRVMIERMIKLQRERLDDTIEVQKGFLKAEQPDVEKVKKLENSIKHQREMLEDIFKLQKEQLLLQPQPTINELKIIEDATKIQQDRYRNIAKRQKETRHERKVLQKELLELKLPTEEQDNDPYISRVNTGVVFELQGEPLPSQWTSIWEADFEAARETLHETKLDLVIPVTVTEVAYPICPEDGPQDVCSMNSDNTISHSPSLSKVVISVQNKELLETPKVRRSYRLNPFTISQESS